MSILAIIVATAIGATTVGATIWSARQDRPDFKFTAHVGTLAIHVIFERGTRAVLNKMIDGPKVDETWLRRTFTHTFELELGRFIHVCSEFSLLKELGSLRWSYAPAPWARRDRPGVAIYGQTIPGFSTQLSVTKFATASTDGHEMRLHLAHAARKVLKLPETNERGKMVWMAETGIYPYIVRNTPDN